MNIEIEKIFPYLCLRRMLNNNRSSLKAAYQGEPLAHETFKRLFSTKIVQSSDAPADSFSTHVIDKLTGEPVEVFVKLESKTLYPIERYSFLVKKGDTFKKIGYRSFDLDKVSNRILPGNMQNIERDKYLGIGVRGHQLAVERMLHNNFDTVEICSLLRAYPFHKGCGFVPFRQSIVPLYQFNLSETLKDFINIFNINKNVVKKLMFVEKDKNGMYILDNDLTMSNLAEYCLQHNLELPPTSGISMQLSKKAIEEWTKLIKTQPIFK